MAFTHYIYGKEDMAEKTEKFQDDKGTVKVVGGRSPETKDVKIVGGGSRPSEIKTMDKHPEKGQ